MKYTIEFSPVAAEDLDQLFDFALQRELDSATGDLEIPERALGLLKTASHFWHRRRLPVARWGVVPLSVN